MTAEALFTLDVCQAGDFPACTMGLTTRWDRNRAAGAVPAVPADHALRSPSTNVSQKEKVTHGGQFKREKTGKKSSKGHVFRESRRQCGQLQSGAALTEPFNKCNIF